MFAPKMSADKALAFDTSNYTTSAATLTVSGEVFNSKKLLPVESGKRGLRQSDAVFAHTKQLYDVFQSLDPSGIEAVGVSTRPRSVEGSYMPCFLVGKNKRVSDAHFRAFVAFAGFLARAKRSRGK